MTKTEKNPIQTRWGGRKGGKLASGFVLGVLALALALPSLAAVPREQAKRMHDRLTGVPPTAAVLDIMEQATDAQAAALIAIDPVQNANAKYFYNVTLKNFATPWTNEAQDVFAPLNDYTALVIGMIRDDVSFGELFSTSLAYQGAASLGLTPVSPSNNNHYVALEASGADLGNSDVLVQASQSIAAGGAAGVFTTRAAARAFFIDGTNRAMFRFAMLNHLCRDMEAVNDTTGIPDRIRQDVSRSPGGDSRIFMNSCVGCHIGMDPMTQAFAYYNFAYTEGNEDTGQLDYTPGTVQPKYLINADNFSSGYVTQNDNWDNYWRTGPNTSLGWGAGGGGSSSGSGAASMGAELGNSAAFEQCQVTKVYRTVCLGEPDQSNVDALLTAYGSNKSMKQVFASAATQCMGD